MKLHTFTQLGILTATSALAFIGGIITADLHKTGATTTAADPYPAAVESNLRAEIDRTQQTVKNLTSELDASQKTAAAESKRADQLSGAYDSFVEAASQNERRYRENLAIIVKDRDDFQQIAANWETAANANKTRADENYAAALSWKQTAETQPPQYTQAPTTAPVQPFAHTQTPLHRALHEQAEPPQPTRKTTQIISTGEGTALIIGPDGKRSHYQSTGEGTAIITTPGR